MMIRDGRRASMFSYASSYSEVFSFLVHAKLHADSFDSGSFSSWTILRERRGRMRREQRHCLWRSLWELWRRMLRRLRSGLRKKTESCEYTLGDWDAFSVH